MYEDGYYEISKREPGGLREACLRNLGPTSHDPNIHMGAKTFPLRNGLSALDVPNLPIALLPAHSIAGRSIRLLQPRPFPVG